MTLRESQCETESASMEFQTWQSGDSGHSLTMACGQPYVSQRSAELWQRDNSKTSKQPHRLQEPRILQTSSGNLGNPDQSQSAPNKGGIRTVHSCPKGACRSGSKLTRHVVRLRPTKRTTYPGKQRKTRTGWNSRRKLSFALIHGPSAGPDWPARRPASSSSPCRGVSPQS